MGFLRVGSFGRLILILFGLSHVTGLVQSKELVQSSIECLALNDYFEARSEPYVGRIGVAYTVLNRSHSSGHSICDTVYSSQQFSWVGKHRYERPTDKFQWTNSLKIANAMLDPDKNILDPTYGAMYYTTTEIHPRWSRDMRTYIVIGNHRFYFERREYP